MEHSFGLGDIVFYVVLGLLVLGSFSAIKSEFEDNGVGKGLWSLVVLVGVCGWLYWSHANLPAGYVRNHSSLWPYAKTWKPGLEDPKHPHVISAVQEGVWHPDYGYSWDDSTAKDFKVHWVAGAGRTDYPHVYSSQSEGYWLAEPGYEFSANGFTTGYEIAPGDRLSLVTTSWVPGKSHPVCDNILTAQGEGRWLPKSGYEFISGSSLSVRHIVATSSYSSGSPDLTGEIVIGGTACVAAVTNKGKGFWGGLSKFVEEQVCDSAVQSGVQKLSGGSSGSSSQVAEEITCNYWSPYWHHTPVASN